MRIKNIGIIKTLDLLDKYKNMKLPQPINYGIARNIYLIQRKYYDYLDALNALFDTYREDMIRDENGEIKCDTKGTPLVKEEVCQQYKRQLDELLSEETDIEFFYVPIEEFNYKDIDEKYEVLTAQDILALQFMIS